MTDSARSLPPTPSPLTVTKRDGTREPYNADRINRAIERAAAACPTRSSHDHPGRLRAGDHAVRRHHHRAARRGRHPGRGAERQGRPRLRHHRRAAAAQDDLQARARRLRDRATSSRCCTRPASPATSATRSRRACSTPGSAICFDLDALAAALDPTRDDLLRYIGTVTMRNRYMITDRDGTALEVPQYFWMRVAMGLSLNEADPTATALEFYDKISRLDYLAAGSTLVNAGTSYPQLSNCFVMQMEDDIEHIAKTRPRRHVAHQGHRRHRPVGDEAALRGLARSEVEQHHLDRADPVHAHDRLDAARGVAAAARSSARCASTWRTGTSTSPQFLDLRQNSGDPYRRTRTANTAVWISDEFMKRVAGRRRLVPLRPAEAPDLVELYGAGVLRRATPSTSPLAEAGQDAELQEDAGARAVQGDPRRAADHVAPVADVEGHHQQPGAQQQHGHDPPLQPVHRDLPAAGPRQHRGLQPRLGQPVAPPVRTVAPVSDGTAVDWDRLAESTRLAVRQLDNLIDITLSSVPESEHVQRANRADRPGRHGLHRRRRAARALATSREEAYDARSTRSSSSSASTPSTRAPTSPASAARTPTSRAPAGRRAWCRSTPRPSWRPTAACRSTVDRTIRAGLGRRCAPRSPAASATPRSWPSRPPPRSVSSPAPRPASTRSSRRSSAARRARASSSRSTATSSRTSSDRGLWEDVREDLLAVAGRPVQLDARSRPTSSEVYKTSFQLSPYAFIEVAARAQKWIDQAISRNIYLADRDVGEHGRRSTRRPGSMGVKTTYYLHMKPRHTAEQSRSRSTRRSPVGRTGAGLRLRPRVGAAAGSPGSRSGRCPASRTAPTTPTTPTT